MLNVSSEHSFNECFLMNYFFNESLNEFNELTRTFLKIIPISLWTVIFSVPLGNQLVITLSRGHRETMPLLLDKV